MLRPLVFFVTLAVQARKQIVEGTLPGGTEGRLAQVVSPDVAQLDHSAGLITYAQSCKVNGRDVPHLVIQGERGPVTLLLMPHEMVDGPQSVTGESVNGVILPVGDGSIAIFGGRDEPLERIEKKVLDSVTWET